MAIILDVSMPNCCNNCPCYDGVEGANDCRATQRDVGELFDESRPDWCPIEGELYLSSCNRNGVGWAFSTKNEIDEAYQYYMEKNFGNRSRPEYLIVDSYRQSRLDEPIGKGGIV